MKKVFKESVTAFDELMGVAETLRDGNGNIEFEVFIMELRERREKHFAVERQRRQRRQPVVHDIGSGDSDDDAPAAEDVAMAPEEPGFSSAVEEANEEAWEQVRGRQRKRALPPPPKTPPDSSGDEGRRSRSPRG